MNAAKAVGRVGGLAVALGVGLAVATGSAVAWADDSGTPSSASDAAKSQATPAARSSGARRVSPRATPKNRHRAGAAVTKPVSPRPAQSGPVSRAKVRTAVDPAPAAVAAAVSGPAAATSGAAPTPAAAEVHPVSAAPSVAAAVVPAVSTAVAPEARIGGVINNMLAAFDIGPLTANTPLAPTETSVMWGLLAWTRRESRQTLPAATVPAPTTTAVAWLTGSGLTGPNLLPRTNNTSAKFGIAGTDVGAMWDNGIADNPATVVDEHQILIAFGDTFSGTGMTGTWRSNVLLRSSDHNPSDGISVPAGAIGDIFSGSPLSAPNFSRQFIKSPGYLGRLGSEVTLIPTAGISVPYNNDYGSRQYVTYMSVKSWDTPGRWTTNYAAVAYSDDNGQTWTVAPSSVRSAGTNRTTTGYVSGNQNFQQSAFVRPAAGSPDENYVYMFGTPSGRAGTVYLSRVDQNSVLDQTRYEYWTGSSWVANKPSAATPVLSAKATRFSFGRKKYPSAGEMSVQYNTYLNRYVMMYTDAANNVVMRTADRPDGTWSTPTTLATSLKYPGLYAPMMDPWTTDQDIYWNMSVWGDYNVLLMHTRLV